MLHDLIRYWFELVRDWGYTGVFFLMALESSIVPVPSEIVMPPAAYWAAQGKMSFWGVVAAGTGGSWFGSAVSYWVARWVGLPMVHRFGKFFFLPAEKIMMAERWVDDYGVMGVGIARLLPVVRHLISIPAGLFRMPFGRFSVVTTLGAGVWCAILSWFGEQVIGDRPALLDSPEEMVAAVKAKLIWFVVGVLLLGGLYAAVKARGARPSSPRAPGAGA